MLVCLMAHKATFSSTYAQAVNVDLTESIANLHYSKVRHIQKHY